jgi:hypothetical protein
MLVSSVCATCFGLTYHPQVFKYIALKLKMYHILTKQIKFVAVDGNTYVNFNLLKPSGNVTYRQV